MHKIVLICWMEVIIRSVSDKSCYSITIDENCLVKDIYSLLPESLKYPETALVFNAKKLLFDDRIDQYGIQSGSIIAAMPSNVSHTLKEYGNMNPQGFKEMLINAVPALADLNERYPENFDRMINTSFNQEAENVDDHDLNELNDIDTQNIKELTEIYGCAEEMAMNYYISFSKNKEHAANALCNDLFN